MSINQSSLRTQQNSVSEKLDELAYLASEMAGSESTSPSEPESRETQALRRFSTHLESGKLSLPPYPSLTKISPPSTLGIRNGGFHASFTESSVLEGMISSRRSEATETEPLLPLHGLVPRENTGFFRIDRRARLASGSAFSIVVLFLIVLWFGGKFVIAWFALDSSISTLQYVFRIMVP